MAQLIKPSKYHRTIDGGELLRRREQRGWTQQQLAEIVSDILNREPISRTYFGQLESKGSDKNWHHEITAEMAEAIEKALKEKTNKSKKVKRYAGWLQRFPEKKQGDNSSMFRLNINIRIRLNKALKQKIKKGHTWDILGYSVRDLAEHLEKQFKKGMSWANYGEWHVDHIIPVCFFKFNSTDDVEFKMCWRLENLRPLWASENLRRNKGIKTY